MATSRLSIDELASKPCVPCEQAERVVPEGATSLLKSLPGWKLNSDVIEKEYRFPSYRTGLDFAVSVGGIADEQNHHPQILVRWRRVKLTFSTHAVKSLTMNDFIMAAKCELEYRKYSA